MTEDLGLSCKELVELVTAYDEGVLPAEEHARFDAHLTECPDCVEYLAQVRRTVAAIGLAAPELERTPPITDLLRVNGVVTQPRHTVCGPPKAWCRW